MKDIIHIIENELAGRYIKKDRKQSSRNTHVNFKRYLPIGHGFLVKLKSLMHVPRCHFQKGHQMR